MDSDIREFIKEWTSENIDTEGVEREVDRTEVTRLAEQLVSDARKAQISEGSIEEEVGDVVSYITKALEEAGDDRDDEDANDDDKSENDRNTGCKDN